jgi:ribulose-5-phosphate 4-epimerase/fuculose-1-phosphate aldolase
MVVKIYIYHLVYIWGKDWIQCKTHAEVYHYIFEVAVKMHQMNYTLNKNESKE